MQGSWYVAQADLELLYSSDPPKVNETVGAYHHAWLSVEVLSFITGVHDLWLCLCMFRRKALKDYSEIPHRRGCSPKRQVQKTDSKVGLGVQGCPHSSWGLSACSELTKGAEEGNCELAFYHYNK